MPQQIYFQQGDIVGTSSYGECIILTRRTANKSGWVLYHLWSYEKGCYLYHNQHNLAMRRLASDVTKTEAQNRLMEILQPCKASMSYRKGDRVEFENTPYVILNGFLNKNNNPYYLVCNLISGATTYLTGFDIKKKLADTNSVIQARAHKLLLQRIVMPGF